MRILQLCLSDGRGGLELYVARLSHLLREAGHECSAITAPGTLLSERMRAQHVPTVELRTRVRHAPLLAAARLAAHLQRERIDILHVHWAKDLPLAVLAKRLCRRPLRLIHSRHMRITRPKKDPYHRLLYGAVDRLVVLSRTMRDEALRYLPLPEHAIVPVYLGVAAPSRRRDPERWPGASSEPNAPLKVGMFGRIEREKGQHLLIEAVDLLRARDIPVHATIIGHAMDEAYLASLEETVRQRGLQQHIEFAGFHPEPMQLMPDFDVIVLATYCETFGLVLVEAMRCGVAVIGSNAGGVPEIIEHGRTGLLFEPGSAASLAEQVALLAGDRQRTRAIAEQGRHRADAQFSDERHLSEIGKLIEATRSRAQSRN
jgi:L-malate glycosyltransferase